jgi:hypothetical protein
VLFAFEVRVRPYSRIEHIRALGHLENDDDEDDCNEHPDPDRYSHRRCPLSPRSSHAEPISMPDRVIPFHGGSKQPDLGTEAPSHVIEVEGAVLREQSLPALVNGHEEIARGAVRERLEHALALHRLHRR